jgi:hypothetical protein
MPNDAGAAHAARGRAASGRVKIFVYDIVVLLVLLAAAAVYLAQKQIFAAWQAQSLSIEAAWFGALGGLMISLKGIYDHRDGATGWDPGFNLWHIGRPLSGGVAGLVTVILLTVVAGNVDKPPANPQVVYAAAFIFGTQERRFFGFLFEAARLIVQVPGDEAPSGLKLTGVQPAEAATGAVVVVKGQGIGADATVKLGVAALDKVTIAADGSYAAGLVPPRPMGADTVDVIVANANGTSFVLPGKFKYTG